MTPENRNLLLALALSLAVMVGWYVLFAGPEMNRAQKQQEIAQQQDQQASAPAAGAGASAGGTPAATSPGASAPPPSAAETAPSLTRDEALAKSQRVAIATGTLSGSINLTGGRIDDLRLNDYHETVDPKSPTIVLLSPSGAPDAYFAEFGWIAPAGAGATPGPDTVWSAPAGAKLTTTAPVTLTYDNGAGLTFTRTISVDDKYMFTITDAVANNSGQSVSLTPYGRVSRYGTVPAGGNYILHIGLIGAVTGQHVVQESYKSLDKAQQVPFNPATAGWLGINDKYWAAILVPEQGKTFKGQFEHIGGAAPGYQADFSGEPLTVAAGGSAQVANRLFAGAKQVAVVDAYSNIDRFDLIIDWGEWLWIITKPMFHVIDFFYGLFGNFGLAILAVTVLIKAAFFPLANKSYKSMSAMKKLQPKIAELREIYKDDKVKQQQAQMELFKKEKVNPLAGCWPTAIQIPVFFSLYKCLYVTIEMRHAPFFGWIHDLSAPDPTNVFTLFGLIPWDPSALPLIGGILVLGAWPLIMGVTMFVQMKLNPTPPDPTQAMIFTWMPVIFTFMLSSFPAGLVIYWAWNNTLSVTQQYIIMRRQGAEVDLLGNILGTFRRTPAKPAVPAPARAPQRAVEDKTIEAEAEPPPRPAPKPKKQGGKPKPRGAGAKARS